ncbi:MAG: solute carrier family 23 protein [Lentisphaerota bacterium]
MGHTEDENNHDLIYKLNDNPPLLEKVFAAFQHICAILIPIMVPGYIVANAIGCDFKTTSAIVSTCLIISGLGTFLQAKKVGPIGSGLLSIQGTSFGFVGILIITGKIGGLPLIFGTCMIGVIIQFVVAYFLPKVKNIFPPVVSGTVVFLIGATLIHVAIDAMAGGQAAKTAGNYASSKFILLGVLVIILIVIFQSSRKKILRIGCILFATVIGFIVAIPLGMVDFSGLSQSRMIYTPSLFGYGIKFGWATLLPMLIIFFVTAIEAIGDITATASVSGEPIDGKVHMKRLSGGVLTDGISSLIGSILGGFPLSCFAQNNGIIQITGVASRYVGFFIAGFLVIAGFFPIVSSIFQIIPQSVLGGGMLIMFGTIMAAGIRILGMEKLSRRSLIIVSVAIAAGMTVENHAILESFPDIIRYSFSSGIGTGGLIAILLNLILPKDKEKLKPHTVQES